TFSVITLRHSMEFTLSPYTTLFRSATALTHQTDDDNFRLGETRHHAEQHAFADAGAGKQAQALPLADGQRRIDGANADIQHFARSEEHTSELQSRENLVCRLLLEKK